jgi:hypothetical protein
MEKIGIYKTIKFYYKGILDLTQRLKEYDTSKLAIYQEDIIALDGVLDLFDKLENLKLKRKAVK